MNLFGIKNKTMDLNVEEAHTIWTLLNERYIIINHMEVQLNFTHDADFKHILGKHLQHLSKECEQLEHKLGEVNIQAPQPSIRGVNVAGNTEVTKDETISMILFNFLRNQLFGMIRVFNDSVTNDDLRSFFLKMAKVNLKIYHEYVDYLKVKGWINVPPHYPFVPQSVEQEISCSEVYNLWNHLVYRYVQTHLTRIYINNVKDEDFVVLLNAGINILTKQATQIEKLLLKYGAPLPNSYANAVQKPETKQKIEDKFIYLILLQGMQKAAGDHGAALAEAIVNPEVRKMFFDLTFSEIDLLDNMLKYGKLKGWLIPPPQYQMV